ncbi:NAD-dependent epimerase/dehydratase family protein [Schumannella luteola]|uniref:Phosphoserine phosphatase/nucleoside-diphosphate-sugar epimerase n=1 Tax=Schumannella luteola TaxID=472059 RepID=A0A852Y8B0_9MICO|nr:phosphoserine phosphatase/nucleoside-diphosphate-sugar epimerase [Schumannella luteola]TPX04673.1 NAD-dependent epimerase/dehydratase family protein [Schumannella luteola]
MTPKRAKTDLGSAHVFLTGATGFVGQAVLERLLSQHPDTRVSVLIRGKGSQSAEHRVRQLLKKPVFSKWREAVGEEAAAEAFASRITVVDGGLTSIPQLPSDLDVVIHSAASVSFDPPIQRAFEDNVGGAIGLYEAVLASGSDPHVVHVSTCYVGGLRKGIAPEASLVHDVDWRAEFEAARQTAQEVELASRRPEVLQKFIAAARAKHGKQGPQAVAAAAEASRVGWVNDELVSAGRMRAQSLGWTDVYTLTKAFAERAAETMWGKAGHTLSIVRPTIIESAFQHPFPGWIDGFKVADPLILAYGRGQLPEFPGLPDSILDLIPVDFVVNAIIAAAANPASKSEPEYFHVASGASNPIPFHRMFDNVRRYYTEHPMPKGDGHVVVPNWKFPGERKVARDLALAKRWTGLQELAISRIPSTDRTREWQAELAKTKAGIETLQNFTDLYRAYVQSEIIFDDRNTRALNAALPAKLRDDRGFDVERIDWDDYLQNVHFPAITEMTNAYRRRKQAATRIANRPQTPKALPERSDVVAVFDLEGTVVDSNIVEQYLWVRSSGFRKAAWPGEVARLLGSVPGYLRAERRDRGEFIRAFLRRYSGMPVERLEKIVRRGYADTMRRHTSADAIARIKEHRAAGHRTVLVTGSIGLLAAPLEHLFDEVVGSTMHSRNGVLTGYLAKPPLVDEARGAWLRRYADEHGINLSQSYGYGDNHSDLGWLGLVGNVTAVNPDAELSREALRRAWRIVKWKSGGSEASRDVMASASTASAATPAAAPAASAAPAAPAEAASETSPAEEGERTPE